MSDSVFLDGIYHIRSFAPALEGTSLLDVVEPGTTDVLKAPSGEESQKWNIKWDEDEDGYRIFNVDTLMYLFYDASKPKPQTISVGKSTNCLWKIAHVENSKDVYIYRISSKSEPEHGATWIYWPALKHVVLNKPFMNDTDWYIEKV